MGNEQLQAGVQYGDYHGTVAADHHDKRRLWDLAEKYGIDTERYSVIGADIFLGETMEMDNIHSQVRLILVDMHEVGQGDFDSIQKYIDEQGGSLPYKRILIDASLEEFLIHFKRFNIVLTGNYRVREFKNTD